MKKLALLICSIALINLTACDTNSEQLQVESNERLDSFTRLEISNGVEDNSGYGVDISELEIAESYKDKNDEPEYITHNDAYKDKYVSNINVDVDAVYGTAWIQDWFDIPDDLNYLEIVYQWVAYAITEYYNGDIPEKFKFNADTDIIDQETNMIYTVLVTGETTNLNILLDTYNYKIIVTEVE